jgi:predicted RNA-binding Zn ribbon-like protein
MPVLKVALIESSVQPGGRPPAPEPLALVQAFVNTVDREHGPDLLDDPDDLVAWAEHRGLAPPPVIEHARELREALRTLLWANQPPVPVPVPPGGGKASPPARPDAVAGAFGVLDAAAAHLSPRFAPPRLAGDDALAAVLSATFLAMADGSWARLKACPGPRCGWAFYDRSVNGSATWCSMRICGNRAKTRAYYSRRR